VPTAGLFTIVIVALLAYLVGGLPFGYWFVRLAWGDDIRTMGSGNIGATNVHRVKGRKAGIIVLLLDMLKGFLAVFLAAELTHQSAPAVGCATFAVMLGHCFPLFLKFKGGKAVACYVGAFLYLAPVVLLAIAILFVLLVAATKYISLASIVSAAVFPLALLAIHPAMPILLACAASSALVIWRHKGNIERLRTGRENVFSFKGGKAA
jgi:glycerol-3-phosphate acyltransferase PlsY